jgi:hypothetical protein
MRDFDIRLALKQTQLKQFYGDSSIIVEELDIPCAGARIDVAVVNGSLHGFEIKSERDTLNRLSYQIEAYTKVFDFVSVIVGIKHLSKVEALLPNWVGIYQCDDKAVSNPISVVREPKRNENTEGFHLAKLLWKDELLSIFDEYGIKQSKSLRAWTLCEILSYTFEKQELSNVVRAKLKERKNWKLNSKAGLRFLQSGDCDKS